MPKGYGVYTSGVSDAALWLRLWHRYAAFGSLDRLNAVLLDRKVAWLSPIPDEYWKGPRGPVPPGWLVRDNGYGSPLRRRL